ncbi:biogenesis of lysosome-related organelles complex 1 subunit 6 isoform X3 [Arvicanthis niloticus]|uniref:biogenesis of lysosome-related organelles complex 1 subunit 6 isoform X3 n=1 Tax=Arvicanthis niloticus TaxID=61156 RepID=UPI00402BF419
MSVPEPPPPDGLLTGLSDRLEAGEPTPGLSDTSPDEGLIEDFAVEDRAVEHLVGGLLSHYLPDLQRSKRALQELTQNQVVLLDTLEQEISKFKECHSMLDINALFTEAKHYHAKLVSIRREMLTLHERTSKLKQQQQQEQKPAGGTAAPPSRPFSSGTIILLSQHSIKMTPHHLHGCEHLSAFIRGASCESSSPSGSRTSI